jgi:hypothetical protein
MKRNWLTYVAIVAALVAGIACSTALADGKGGSRSRGNSSARSMSGGSGGSSMKFSGNTQAFKSQGGQNLNQGLKRVQLAPSSQFKTMPGNFNSSQLGKNVSSQTLNKGGLPKFDQAKKFSPVPSPSFPSKPQISLSSEAVKSLAPGVLVKKPGLGIKPGLVAKLPPGFLGPKPIKPIKPIGPICNPCYHPSNKWCGPCWWWSPSFCNPCYTGCYYPPVYTYPQTIVMPVATTVVTTAATQVVPVVATEVVAEKLMQIPVGSTITLQGQDLGEAAGQVVVQIDKISLPAQMNEWKVDSASVKLPMLGLAGPTKAQIWMVKADGAVAASMAVELIPAQPPTGAAADAAVVPVAGAE